MKNINLAYPVLRKPVAILLLLMMLTSLYIPVSAAETTPDSTGSGTSATTAGKEPLILKWVLPGETPEDFDRITAKVNEYLKSKDSISIEFIFRKWDSFTQYKNVLIAAGEPIDIIYSAGWAGYKTDAQRGSLRPLNDLITNYAPKTAAAVGKIPLKAAEVNGKVYGLPTPGQASASASGISFRKDLVSKYNINLSAVKKLADVEPVLKTIKSKQPSLIPMISGGVSPMLDTMGLESLGNSFMSPGVIRSSGKDTKVVNEYAQPEVTSFFKTLNKLNKLGYLKGSASVPGGTASGKIFSVYNASLSPTTCEDDFNYQWINVYLSKPTITANSALTSLSTLPAASVHPQQAMQLLERINTDSYLTNLFHFGIEGEHYVKNSNGTIGFPPGVHADNTTYAPFTNNWLLGNRYLDLIWKNEDVNKYKILKSFNDNASKTRSFGFYFRDDGVVKEDSACSDIVYKYWPKLFSGEFAPEKYLPLLNGELKKAGLDKLLAEKQKQYTAWLNGKASLSDISILLNGALLSQMGNPILESGVVLMPMKNLLDSLDCIYDYNGTAKTVTVRSGNISLKLTAGSKAAVVNGKAVNLSVAPKLLDNQLYLPTEFVCQTFGFIYKWNNTTKTATITGGSAYSLRGNTAENLANSGFIAQRGDWLYLALDENGLYRMKKDGSQKTKISDKSVGYLNVTQDYVYYLNAESGASSGEYSHLYRIKPDGTQKIKLSATQVSNVSLVGDWIYYFDTDDGNKPYKMSLDGKLVRKLSDNSVSSMTVNGGWIYYHQRYSRELYRMRTCGSDEMMIIQDGGYGLPAFDTTGEWMYYSLSNRYSLLSSSSGASSGIFRCKPDGSGSTQVTMANAGSMHMDGEWLYYLDGSGSIYRLNEKEHRRERIAPCNGLVMAFAGDWMYYVEIVENEESAVKPEDLEDDLDSRYALAYYRISRDGMTKQKFDNKATLAEVYTRKPGQTALESKPVLLPSTAPQTTLKTSKELTRYRDAVAHLKVYDATGNLQSTGSGFVITSNGVVVTNYHVISGASSVECSFDTGKTYKVDYVLNYNPKKDIAILQLKDASGLPTVSLGDSDKVELADDVLAIGNPLDLQNTLSTGIISGIRKIIGMHYLQTNASISPGSSGGPLFNMYGDVIGITSMTISGTQNLNFAVPINQVKQLFSTSRVIPLSQVEDYEETVYEFEKNDSLATADPCTMDQYLNGTISDEKDVDYYKFTLAGSSTVELYGSFNDAEKGSTKPSGLSIVLLDESGKMVTEGKDVTEEELHLAKVTATLGAGTYYLSVKRAGSRTSGTKDYSITTMVN